MVYEFWIKDDYNEKTYFFFIGKRPYHQGPSSLANLVGNLGTAS